MGGVQGAHRRAGGRPPGRLSAGSIEHATLVGQRERPVAFTLNGSAGRGARRWLAARRAARAPRHHVGEGRLQPAGSVRVLHGVGRRSAARRVRHAGRSRRRSGGHDARGPRRRRPVGRGVLRQRREPVRLLHAGDHHARRRPHRSHRGQRSARRCSPTSAAAPAGTPSSPPFCLLQIGAPLRLEQTGPGVRRRAALEGGVAQDVGAHVALGRGGFADDTAPPDALVALLDADGEWVVGESLAEARQLSGKIQGRRTTAPLRWPIEVPDGAWMRTLQTTWVEPAYLEPDAAWCEPGGEPASSLGNGGAFGGKIDDRGRRRRPAPRRRARPRRCASCSRARTSCGAVRSVRRSRPACAPTAPGSSGSRARRGSPRRSRSIAPGLRGRGGRRRRAADHERRPRGGLGRGGGPARLDRRRRSSTETSTR